MMLVLVKLKYEIQTAKSISSSTDKVLLVSANVACDIYEASLLAT